MNAALVTTIAMLMQNVQTLMVALNVIVMKATLEMVCGVEVSLLAYIVYAHECVFIYDNSNSSKVYLNHYRVHYYDIMTSVYPHFLHTHAPTLKRESL